MDQSPILKILVSCKSRDLQIEITKAWIQKGLKID